jgi:hypothetical protein
MTAADDPGAISTACWWCDAAADSREHKFKRSDLVRDFGSGAWSTGDAGVAHFDGKAIREARSSGAKGFKFARVVCSDCNSRRSQPFDLAYDQFTSYMVEHEQDVLGDAGFAWSDVFPEEWLGGRDNVVRYWVKHIGTRIAAAGPVFRAEYDDSSTGTCSRLNFDCASGSVRTSLRSFRIPRPSTETTFGEATGWAI